MALTESYMMLPSSSVSALCFSHRASRYFSVGQVNEDQVVDYAKRTGTSVRECERWLGSTVIGYERGVQLGKEGDRDETDASNNSSFVRE